MVFEVFLQVWGSYQPRMLCMLQLVEKLLLQRRRSRWSCIQEGGGTSPVSILSLTAPRLNVLCNVERVTLRVVENVGIALRLVSAEPNSSASVPCWCDWLQLLIRLVCMDGSQYSPSISVSSLGDAAVSGQVVFPLSAFDINVSKLLVDALQKDVPVDVLTSLFESSVESLCSTISRVRSVINSAMELLASVTSPTSAPIRTHDAVVFPLQVWGLTNVARTGSATGILVSDPERAKRMVQQCRDSVDAQVLALMHLFQKRSASVSGVGFGSRVWQPIQSVIDAVVPLPDAALSTVDVHTLPSALLLACVKQRTKAGDSKEPSSDVITSGSVSLPSSAAVAGVAAFVPLQKVGGMLSALAYRDWVIPLAWPSSVLVLLSPGEAPAAVKASAAPQDVAVAFLDTIVRSILPHVPISTSDPRSGSGFSELHACVLRCLHAGALGMVPNSCDVVPAVDTAAPAAAALGEHFTAKRACFARFCIGQLFSISSSAGSAPFQLQCQHALLEVCALFLEFYNAAEAVAAPAVATGAPMPADRTMTADAVIVTLILKHFMSDASMWAAEAAASQHRVHTALCDTIPTQAGLLRHVVKDALKALYAR